MSHSPTPLTFKTWLVSARSDLERGGIESPYLSAQLILEQVTGQSRSTILAHPERELETSQFLMATSLLERRLRHEPMAYLLGHKEFRHLTLKVSPDVLIPRPETEELVDLAVRLAPGAKSVLDAGTGSGCIPLALVEFFPETLIMGCDISFTALSLARENDPSHRVNWFQSFWLEAVAPGSLDLLLSNPPYLTTEEMASLEPQVQGYEPHLALDGGTDGCDCYRLLVPQAAHVLKMGGVVLFEASPATVGEVSSLFVRHGFGEIQTHQDLAGRQRFVSAVRQ